MNFKQLVKVYQELEKTQSGNKLREILSDFFKIVPKDDIALISYLTLGQISSDYENINLGIAEKSVLKAISKAGGVSENKVKGLIIETGDAGLVAERILKNKPQTLIPVGKLTIHNFYDDLIKLSKLSGTGSQDQKSNILVSILQKTSSNGSKYVTRIVLGTLRLGVAEMTVIDSLAIAFTGEKSNKKILEKAYNICPDVGVIAETVSDSGLKGLENIKIKVGRPIKMMLAQRISELSEISKKMPGKVSVEGKYDGERVQAHKDKTGKINLFSRRLENISSQFPDLVKYIGKIEAEEFIVEAEIIAIDNEGNHLPFQTLMKRRRKHDIAEYIQKIPVQAKNFDLLYCNGKSYLDEEYEKRVEKLGEIIPKSKHLTTAERIITDDVEKIDEFFQQMLNEKYEGIMIKSLQGEYQAGTRGWNWIKWKKEYVKDMIDTFDLVIVGAFYGRGRRSGTYGALLCAAYNDKVDQFETLCKLGTGLTDKTLAELPGKLKEYKLKHKPARLKIKKEMHPDVWFSPGIVVEVLAAEVTKSPHHSVGLALRFPRFVKYRDDKKAEQATTCKEVKEIYES